VRNVELDYTAFDVLPILLSCSICQGNKQNKAQKGVDLQTA